MASTAVAAGDDAVGPRKGTGGGRPPPPPPEQGLRCPRCDSPNTKFCYYNNYSLSQPRHFCKTCRRYWTMGGALRNVPVGGGCRKNKRSRSAAVSSRLSLNLPVESICPATDPAAASARLGFLGGGTLSSPLGGATVDFQGAVSMLPLPRLHSPAVSQYVPFGGVASGAAPGDITSGGNVGAMNGGHGPVSSTIASSIESLSFINQDLHWKLQQQRLSTMFLGPPSSAAHVDGGSSIPAAEHGGGGPFLQMAAASWFTDSSYALPSPPPPAAAVATTSSNINSGRSSAGGDDNATPNNNNNCGSAIPAWGDISTFATLP